MKTICRPSYPALSRATAGDQVIREKGSKGFVVFFIAIVLATVSGMIVFLSFVSKELSEERESITEGNGIMRDLFSGYSMEKEKKTAPFSFDQNYEKDMHEATPYK